MKNLKGQTSAAALRALTRPPRGAAPGRSTHEPSASPSEWARDIVAGNVPKSRGPRLRWPLPFETLSPLRTVGRPGTNLHLLRPTQFDSGEGTFPTGFASWDAGVQGLILTRFKAEPYGFSGVGTFVFALTLRAAFSAAGFRFSTTSGSLVGSSTVTVPANTTKTVTATITNLAATTSSDLFLERISGGGFLWFKTTIREPGIVSWPPSDILVV